MSPLSSSSPPPTPPPTLPPTLPPPLPPPLLPPLLPPLPPNYDDIPPPPPSYDECFSQLRIENEKEETDQSNRISSSPLDAGKQSDPLKNINLL